MCNFFLFLLLFETWYVEKRLTKENHAKRVGVLTGYRQKTTPGGKVSCCGASTMDETKAFTCRKKTAGVLYTNNVRAEGTHARGVLCMKEENVCHPIKGLQYQSFSQGGTQSCTPPVPCGSASPCLLCQRHTTFLPQLHIRPTVLRRGAPWQCCSTYVG